MSEKTFRIKVIDALTAQGGIITLIKREFTASTAYAVIGEQGQRIIIIDDFLLGEKHAAGEAALVAWLDQLKARGAELPQVHNPNLHKGFVYFFNSFDAILFGERGFVSFENLKQKLDQNRSAAAVGSFYGDVQEVLRELAELRPKDARIPSLEDPAGQTPITASYPGLLDPNKLKDAILGALRDNDQLQVAVLLMAQDLAGAIKMDIRKNVSLYQAADRKEIFNRAALVATEAFKLFHDFAIAKNRPFAGTRAHFQKALLLPPAEQLMFLTTLFEETLALGSINPEPHQENVAFLKRLAFDK
jgi:hypothetical protein